MLPLFFDTTSQYAVNCEVLYPSEKPFEFDNIKLDLTWPNAEPFVFTICGFENASSSASLIKLIFFSLLISVSSKRFNFFGIETFGYEKKVIFHT